MFKHENEENQEGVDTIIGPTVSVEGNFKGEGNIIVEGEVKGSLKTKGFVKATETSVIMANINAGNAEIAGQVVGNIKIKDSLDIKETAQIQGDIDTATISVAYGAAINGNLKMRNERSGTAVETEEQTEKESEK